MAGAPPAQELQLVSRPQLRVLSIDVGLRNLALWLGTICTDDLKQTTEVWRVVDVVERQGLQWASVNDHTIPECCDLVDAYFASAGCDVSPQAHPDIILIEQQPTNTGFPGKQRQPSHQQGVSQIRMFGISLTMRQTLKRMFPDAYMADFVSPKLKLQLLDEEAKAEAKAETDRARRRKIHKARTIAIVQTMADVPQDQGRKLDDLADCWLQARAWVHVRRCARAKAAVRDQRAAQAAEKKATAAAKRAQAAEKQAAAQEKRTQAAARAAEKRAAAAAKRARTAPKETAPDAAGVAGPSAPHVPAAQRKRKAHSASDGFGCSALGDRRDCE